MFRIRSYTNNLDILIGGSRFFGFDRNRNLSTKIHSIHLIESRGTLLMMLYQKMNV